MEILTKIFGITTKYEAWNKKGYLPLYISGSYDFQGLNIDGYRCIMISPVGETTTIPTLKKQITRIQEIDDVPVVVFQKTMTSVRRKSMIEKRIPFITEKQVYLPFMGTYLEKQSHEKKRMTRLTASAQLVLLLYLYGNKKKLYISDAGKKLPFTAMTMSRAVKQLEELELFEITKDGVNIVIESKYSKRKLYEIAKTYMSNPVLYSGFAEKENLTGNMCFAGITALSEKTMLNDNHYKTYAVSKDKYDKHILSDELVEPDKQVALEIWSYDPKILTQDNTVDPISLALSFKDSQDERIESAIDEMLDNTLVEE